jgi:hypothetical protein
MEKAESTPWQTAWSGSKAFGPTEAVFASVKYNPQHSAAPFTDESSV